MQRITSRHNPIVARFRAAARGGAGDLLLLDGIHLISDALKAEVCVDTVAFTAEAAAREEIATILESLSGASTELVQVTAPVLDAMTPVRSASGIVALADRPDAGTDACFRGDAPLVVIAADVQDPGNIGAIVRVAEAAGATGVMTTAGSADPFGWKALRGSMGSALRLRIGRCGSLDEAVAVARAHGCAVIATTPRDGVPFSGAALGGAVAILIGGEGAGLPQAIVDAADERVTIPMAPPVESLNAAVTAALLVYEARRQRDTSVGPRKGLRGAHGVRGDR